jgi:secretion/DNA translocation related TadE-like protein
VVALVAVALPLYMALAGRSAATGAADAAALAAADARSGAVGGSPCALAERVAAANRADLEGCHVDGLVVTVGASIRVGIFHITAHATAGPPGGQGR